MMENLEFRTEQDLDDYLSKFPIIGKGTEGKCYLIEGKWVLKKFKTAHNIDFGDDYLKFRNVKIDNVAFVRYLVGVEGFLAGVIAPYLKGANIKSFPLSWEEISKVVWAIQNLITVIQKLNKAEIWVWDTHVKNIIYHNKKLGIIDTIMFDWFKGDLSKEKENWLEVMLPVLHSAFSDAVIQYLNKVSSDYKDYSKDMALLQNPRELLLGVKSELEEFLQMPIERFRDAEEPLRRILEK